MFENKNKVFETSKKLYELCETISNSVVDRLCENDTFFNFNVAYHARFDFIELTVERENCGINEKLKVLSFEFHGDNFDNIDMYSGTYDDMKLVTKLKLDYNYIEWLINAFLQ